jgi:hypothetical protein
VKQSWFFEKTNKIDKPLAKLNKRKREKTQINKIKGEKGAIATNINTIQRIIREYFKNLCSNLEKVNKFLDAYFLLKLKQEYINHLNRSITSNAIKVVIRVDKEEPRT